MDVIGFLFDLKSEDGVEVDLIAAVLLVDAWTINYDVLILR